MPTAPLPPIDQSLFDQHTEQQTDESVQGVFAELDQARQAQEAARQAERIAQGREDAEAQQRAQAQLASVLEPARQAQAAAVGTRQAQDQLDAVLAPARAAQQQALAPRQTVRAPQGSFAGQSQDEQAALSRVYQDARAAGLDDEGARVAQAVARTEHGYQGALGDADQSAGTFQLFHGGGMGDEYARQQGITTVDSIARLRQDPHAANAWALSGYLGNAIREGQRQGLRGAELATFVQRTGQRSVSPERTGANYEALQNAPGGLFSEPSSTGPSAGVEAVSRADSSLFGAAREGSRVEALGQFEQGLPYAEASAICGPVAALAFAQQNGRMPDLGEARRLARARGWTPEGGMNGVQNEQALLTDLGVASRLDTNPDFGEIAADAASGNPVIVSTPRHYYYVNGYDQASGRLRVGKTGLARRGGSEWMSAQEIANLDGGINGVLYVDSPASPAPSVAAQPSLLERAGSAVAGAFAPSTAEAAELPTGALSGIGRRLGRAAEAVGVRAEGVMPPGSIGRSLEAAADAASDPTTGRVLRPAAREVVDAYDRLSAGRAPVIRQRAIDYLAGDLGREDLRPLLERTFDAGKRMLRGAKTITTELSPVQLEEILRTGQAPRSMFGAVRDEDAAARAAYASVNGFPYSERIAAENAAAGTRRKGERITLDEARQFNATVAQADRAALGSTEYLGQDADAVPRMYGLVTEGEMMPNERQGLVYVYWKPGTERVSTLHHHFGLVDAERDYHAGMHPGLRALIEDQPGGTVTLPSGRTISDTPWLVGPGAEDDMRMAALTASMPKAVRDKVLSGELTDPEDLAAVLLRGGMGKNQPLKRAAVEQGLALTTEQLKKAGLPEDYAYHLAQGVNANRTETLILDPSLHNVQAIYVQGPPEALARAGTRGVPSSLEAAERLADAVERATGTRPPVVQAPLVPGMRKGIDPRLSPGRQEIVDRYTRAGFADIGEADPGYAALLGAGAAGVAGASALGLAGGGAPGGGGTEGDRPPSEFEPPGGFALEDTLSGGLAKGYTGQPEAVVAPEAPTDEEQATTPDRPPFGMEGLLPTPFGVARVPTLPPVVSPNVAPPSRREQERVQAGEAPIAGVEDLIGSGARRATEATTAPLAWDTPANAIASLAKIATALTDTGALGQFLTRQGQSEPAAVAEMLRPGAGEQAERTVAAQEARGGFGGGVAQGLGEGLGGAVRAAGEVSGGGEGGLLDAAGRPIRPPKGDVAPILDELGNIVKEVEVKAPRTAIPHPEFLQPEAAMPTRDVSLVRQGWDRVRNVLGSMGESGKELADRYGAWQNAAEVGAAADLQRMPTVDKLGKSEFTNLVDVLEGNAKPASARIAQAATEAKGVLDDLFSRAANAQVAVAERIDNYFPHVYKDATIRARLDTARRGELIRRVMDAQNVAQEEATGIVHRWLQGGERDRRQGSLEMARLANLPGYEKTKEALYNHVLTANRRLHEVAQFGRDDAIANRLLDRIGAEGYPLPLARDLFQTLVGAHTYPEGLQKLSRATRAWQTLSRLGWAVIGNAAQPVNQASVTGLVRTMMAAPKAAFSATERDFAERTGVTLDQVIREVREGGGWSDQVTGKVLKPFSVVEDWNRRWAAIGGRDFARDMAARAAGTATGLNRIGTRAGARRALEVMGLDADAIIKRGGRLTPEEEIAAARNINERVNFRNDPGSIPEWASHPAGRIMFQFKAFPYSQTAFLKRELLDEAFKGNVAPLVRFAILAPLANAAATEARNYVTGRDPEEDPNLRWVQYALGPLGLVGDLSRVVLGINSKYVPAERRASMVAGSLFGPTVGSLTEAGAAGLSLADIVLRPNTGTTEAKLKPAIRFAARQIPYLGPKIANTLAPYKDQGSAPAGAPTSGPVGRSSPAIPRPPAPPAPPRPPRR